VIISWKIVFKNQEMVYLEGFQLLRENILSPIIITQ